jgi:hypothetical protein
MLSKSLATAETLRRTPTVDAVPALPEWSSLRSGRLKRFAPTVLVVLLLGATAVAFVFSERVKLQDSPVLGTQIDHLISPVSKAPDAKIAFRLRREENLRLDIADSRGTVVRHGVGSGLFGAAFHEFAWDGRDDSGRVVPDGRYRVELRLPDEGRTIAFPDGIRVDSTPPRIQVLQAPHAVFSPDRDGHADHVDVHFRFSEPAYPILYVNGKSGPRGPLRLAGAMQWYGLIGRRTPPGTYRLALVAEDPAGNLAPSTREFTVRVRYVELSRKRYVTRGGPMRLRVSTDAIALHYVLVGRGGRISRTVRAKVAIRSFVLPVPRLSGRYRLTVTVNGWSARASVIVR